jgi:MFS transporter, DHA1 family, multidrug resistance protein
MAWLIAGRALQGIAMGAGVMAARAVVRDLFAPAQGANVMSQALTGLGIIACTCAPLGGLLTDWLGWRVALLAVATFGAQAPFALLAWRFEETLAQPDAHACNVAPCGAPTLTSCATPCSSPGALCLRRSYLGSVHLFGQLVFCLHPQFMGYSKTAYGFLMLSMSLSYIVGTFWCRWMLRRTSVHRTVGMAAVLTITGGVSMAALAHAGEGQAGTAPGPSWCPCTCSCWATACTSHAVKAARSCPFRNGQAQPRH